MVIMANDLQCALHLVKMEAFAMLNDVWIRDNDGIVHHSQVHEVRQWTLPILLIGLMLVGSLPGMIMSVIESL